ncbi:hypothetical protein ACINK0_03005 [Deinococcus sp. VB343]|uniref:Uncharacterized protein n=1 Tax=Deinococcus sp. VB142 TaxID=3112952 RepID=A0AAU6Q113_9DEIO
MKHTAAFIAARDALGVLLADPDRLNTDPAAIAAALSALDAAGRHVVQGESDELPAPPDPQPGALLGAAWAALGEYTARELPAWGSAECAQLLAPLCYAAQALELLGTLHALSADAPAPQNPRA